MMTDAENLQLIKSFPSAFMLEDNHDSIYITDIIQKQLHFSQNMLPLSKKYIQNIDDFIQWLERNSEVYFDMILIDQSYTKHRYRVQCISVHGYKILPAVYIHKEDTDTADIDHRDLIDSMPCGLFCAKLDDSFTFLYQNHYFTSRFLYDDTNDLKNIRQLIPQKDFERFHNHIMQNYENAAPGENFEIEKNCICKDGTHIWVMACYSFYDDFMYGAVFDITRRKKIEEELKISKQEYQIAMEQSNNALLRYHIPTHMLTVENASENVFGGLKIMKHVPECVPQMNLISEETLKEYMAFYQKMIDGEPKSETLFKILGKKGKKDIWIKAKYVLTYDEENHPITSIISYQNYTKEYEEQIAYKRWKQTFEKQKKNAVVYYEYDITNDRLEMMESDVITAATYSRNTSFTYVAKYSCQRFVYPGDHELYMSIFNREYFLSCYHKHQYEFICDHRRYDDFHQPYWARGEIQLIEDPYTNAIKAFVLIRNIDDDIKKQQHIKRQLESDPLTGLYNRRSITKHIHEIIKDKPECMHALIMLDLDHFKQLNDQLGHLKGDEILCKVANILNGSLRRNDLCARLGGDEFVLFLQDIKDSVSLHRKLSQLCNVLRLQVGNVDVSASIGASIYPLHGDNFITLYQKADHAMYNAKHNGKNCYMIYED